MTIFIQYLCSYIMSRMSLSLTPAARRVASNREVLVISGVDH